MQTFLCDLAYKYKSDKTDLYLRFNKNQHCHNYTPYYYNILKNKRLTATNVLELGIGILDERTMAHMADYDYKAGASLKVWRDFFPFAIINGIDINPKAIFLDERINTHICSQVDENMLKKLFKNDKFDLILDDGSHMPEHQLKSLDILFDYLKDDGVYIIEDVYKDLFRDDFMVEVLGGVDLKEMLDIKEYNLREGRSVDNFFYEIRKRN